MDFMGTRPEYHGSIFTSCTPLDANERLTLFYTRHYGHQTGRVFYRQFKKHTSPILSTRQATPTPTRSCKPVPCTAGQGVVLPVSHLNAEVA